MEKEEEMMAEKEREGIARVGSLGEGEGVIAGKGVRHSRVGKHGRAAGEELNEDDEKPHDGAASATACVEKNLSGG